MRAILTALALFTLSSNAYAQGVYMPQLENDAKPSGANLIGSIMLQFMQCWTPPAPPEMAKSYKHEKVLVDVALKEDGSLISAKLGAADQLRYASDDAFRLIADSAIRAVHTCMPLKNLQVQDYAIWKELELTFDTSASHF